MTVWRGNQGTCVWHRGPVGFGGILCILGVLAGFASAGATPVAMSRADDLIAAAIGRGELPGAVLLVGRGDEIVYRKAYGSRAVRPAPAPMTPETVFDIASLSKPLGCATAVMLLAERGKLKLDDSVAKYLLAFGVNGKERITVEQLLLHHGGLIPDNPLSDYEHGPAAAIRNVCALKTIWEPGTHFAYTDVGYIVLGELVKAVDGRPLDRFAAEELFGPLGMTHTAYNPPDALKSRCAPTEQRGGRWMLGEVHDPRAYALGGVAGHAGVFSTADDLARYCRMILGGGVLEGKRILAESTVERMTRPRRLPDGAGWRTYGFDVDTPYSSARGERFERGATFGHTGFTGTMFWMDPKSKCYVILLANAVHPDGKGKIVKLRREVSTAVAEALLGPAPEAPEKNTKAVSPPPAGGAAGAAADTPAPAAAGRVLCGIDVLKRDGYKLLRDRRVAIVTNHTGRDREGNRLIDVLAAAPGVRVVKLFSPEHGLQGVLDEKVGHTIDENTGLKVYSLYGESRRPTAEMLAGVDTLVFDIQDIGARFYTYISTMGLCMEEAAKHKIKMIVLDRPNPNTGLLVDGPVARKEHFSFIAYGPLPVAHGMTIGELARLFNTEFKIGCDLEVVPVQGWSRRMWWDETGLMWVNPSPNIRNPTQALLYLAVGLLETSNLSVGRGTDQPFELFGAPWVDGRRLAAALNGAKLPGLRFVPVTFEPKSSKFAGETCEGVYVFLTDRNAFSPVRSGVTMAWHLKKLFGDSYQIDLVGKMLHNADAMKALQGARDPAEVPEAWEAELESFRKTRQKYLLYR